MRHRWGAIPHSACQACRRPGCGVERYGPNGEYWSKRTGRTRVHLACYGMTLAQPKAVKASVKPARKRNAA